MPKVNVQFGADTSQLASGVRRAKGQLAGLKTSALKIGGAMAGIFGGARLVSSLKGFVDEMDRFSKLADRFGMSAETMQRFGHAADLAGADTEKVAIAMQKMVKSGQDAANGLSTQTRAFGALGINIAAFNAASPEEMFVMLGKGINGASTEAVGLAAALDIAGRSAGELMPAFKSIDDFEAAMKKTKVATNEQVEEMVKLKDAMTTLQNQTTPWKAAMVGAVTDVIQALKDAIKVVDILGERYGRVMAGGGRGSFVELWKDIKDVFTGGASKSGGVADGLGGVASGGGIPGKSAGKPEYDLSEFAKGVGSPGSDIDFYTKVRMEEARKLQERLRIENTQMKLGEGILAAEEKKAGMSPGTVVADSLTRIGGGGNASFSANPQLRKMDQTISELKKSVELLERIAEKEGGATYQG